METQIEINEQRHLERHSVKLDVYSQETDELIGHAENLHTEGMMILSKQKMPENQEIRLWFGAAKDDKRLSRIFLSAYRVWTSFSDDEERLYCSGLHFVSPSEDTLDKIHALILETKN